MGCQTWQIPDIKVYKEIPFVDAPEGIFINTVSDKEGIISAPEWLKLQPELVCLDAEGWLAVKLSWLKACRLLNQNEQAQCLNKVESVEKLVKELDAVAEEVLAPLLP